MEFYLKKYFWVLNVTVIVVCASLAATAVNHFVSAEYLVDLTSNFDARPMGPKKPKPQEKPKTTATKDSSIVVARNIFCSGCETEKPADAVATSAPASDPNHPPATTLPLVLLATSVAHQDRLSSATIANTFSNKSGAYWLNDAIPDAGLIVRISPKYVDFHNDGANRVERIDLVGGQNASPARPVSQPPIPPVAGGGPEAEFMAQVDAGVKKLDETHYEIERNVVDKALSDPTIIARAARIVPSTKDGKPDGFKMYAIRPNSVYAKIGFQNGDTINSINGFDMTSPDKALEVYTKVKSASNLSITVTRRGQPVSMEYRIK